MGSSNLADMLLRLPVGGAIRCEATGGRGKLVICFVNDLNVRQRGPESRMVVWGKHRLSDVSLHSEFVSEVFFS